jgi:hypothetical protein
MIKKRVVAITGLIFLAMSIFAQVEEPVVAGNQKEKEKLNFSERLVFGGDIGLSFGTITYIKLAPVIGYRITSRLTAGLGPIYIYENYKAYKLETSTYGGKAILSFTVFKGSSGEYAFNIGDIVLHAENELINVESIYLNTQTQMFYFGDRLWIDNLLLGGGISQPISGRFSFSLFILWDVTGNEFSPYNNPVLKFGFSF